jgi:hypothetical protein
VYYATDPTLKKVLNAIKRFSQVKDKI